MSRIPRVRIPVPVEAVAEHACPKVPAPVGIGEAGERTPDARNEQIAGQEGVFLRIGREGIILVRRSSGE